MTPKTRIPHALEGRRSFSLGAPPPPGRSDLSSCGGAIFYGGSPRRFFLSSDSSSTARGAGDQAHASPPRSNSFSLPPASPRCAAALGASTLRTTNWSWTGGRCSRRGRPGTGDGERRTQEESRPRLVLRPQVLNRLVSPVRLVGRLRKTIA